MGFRMVLSARFSCSLFSVLTTPTFVCFQKAPNLTLVSSAVYANRGSCSNIMRYLEGVATVIADRLSAFQEIS